MARCIQKTLSSTTHHVIIASEIDTACYRRYFADVPALFEDVEVAAIYEQFSHATSVWKRFRYGLTWAKQRHYLVRLLRSYQACTVVSEPERRLLTRIAPRYKAIHVIPNCIDLTEYKGYNRSSRPRTLIFTGSFRYQPNYEAMVWFLTKVYPRIKARIPDVKLVITGDGADRALPPITNVTQTGHVDDVRLLIAQAWVSVTPLHRGAGTRLKILEAMALRTPVVSTPKGAEGLELQDGHHLLLADTPEDFAQQVIRVLTEPALRHHLASEAYQRVAEKYTWTGALPRFLSLVAHLAGA
jgi:glycosyltransferase involved in cell wall biosynthesis